MTEKFNPYPWTVALTALAENHLLMSDTTDAMVVHLSEQHSIGAVGMVFASTAMTLGFGYRQGMGYSEDQDMFLQVEFPDWEETRDQLDYAYTDSLRFLNSALNNDAEASIYTWASLVTPDTSQDHDEKVVARILFDIQQFACRAHTAVKETHK